MRPSSERMLLFIFMALIGATPLTGQNCPPASLDIAPILDAAHPQASQEIVDRILESYQNGESLIKSLDEYGPVVFSGALQIYRSTSDASLTRSIVSQLVALADDERYRKAIQSYLRKSDIETTLTAIARSTEPSEQRRYSLLLTLMPDVEALYPIAFTHPNTFAKKAAVQGIGAGKDPKAVPLVETLFSTSQSPLLVQAAAKAAARLTIDGQDTSSLLPALERILSAKRPIRTWIPEPEIMKNDEDEYFEEIFEGYVGKRDQLVEESVLYEDLFEAYIIIGESQKDRNPGAYDHYVQRLIHFLNDSSNPVVQKALFSALSQNPVLLQNAESAKQVWNALYESIRNAKKNNTDYFALNVADKLSSILGQKERTQFTALILESFSRNQVAINYLHSMDSISEEKEDEFIRRIMANLEARPDMAFDEAYGPLMFIAMRKSDRVPNGLLHLQSIPIFSENRAEELDKAMMSYAHLQGFLKGSDEETRQAALEKLKYDISLEYLYQGLLDPKNSNQTKRRILSIVSTRRSFESEEFLEAYYDSLFDNPDVDFRDEVLEAHEHLKGERLKDISREFTGYRYTLW